MTGSRRQVHWLLPAAMIAATATVGLFTPTGSALAQPALDDDPCMSATNAIGNGAQGGTTSIIIINNGNSSCVVSNGSNGSNGVNNSVTSVSTQNGNSVNTTCINGRCCVQTNGGPPTCNP